jgi:predicted metal-dependent hydrolase
MTMQSLTVDDLTFEVRRSPRRKTVEITVDRGGELIVSGPMDVENAAMESFIRDKKFWVYTKLAEKQALQQPIKGKDFVTGEGFPYLGRSYRLLVVDAQDRPLKFEAGRFRMLRTEVGKGREHFVRWYSEHALGWIRQRVRMWAKRLAVEPTRVEIRELGYRWGSCSKDGGLNFHWATMLLPSSLVEYVIVHELVHLHEPNHTPEFWQRVERAMPDYEQRKAWLAEHGGRHVVL